MSPLGILFGAPGKPPFRRRVPLVFTGLTAGATLWGSSLFTGVNRGGGGGGFGFLRTVRIADGCAGGLMSGALACTLIFSRLEAVVLLELLFRVSVLELSVISSSSCRSEVRVSIWSTTSLSSLATSFRSPRTNSRSSTMILICSFTLVLEPAGGPSAREDEEGVPLGLEDILWGQTRQVSGGGQAEAAARPRPWRCCGRCRPNRPASWKHSERRVAALGARPGGRTVVLPSTPRDAALGAGLQTGQQRACASARRLPPLAHSRARSPPRVGMPAEEPRAVSSSPRRGTSLRDRSRNPWASEGGKTSSCLAHPHVWILKSPHPRSQASVFSHLD